MAPERRDIRQTTGAGGAAATMAPERRDIRQATGAVGAAATMAPERRDIRQATGAVGEGAAAWGRGRNNVRRCAALQPEGRNPRGMAAESRDGD
jgi:hypothetical protein